MRAIVLTRYGGPEGLELRDVEKPTPTDDQVRIQVHASAINDWEWFWVRGKPFAIRAFSGLARPSIQIIGCDISGQVESVGRNVTHLRAGDEVYGDLSESGFGAFAEYVCVPATSVVPKPRNVTHEQAAAIPHAGMLAQQGLYDIGQVDHVQTLLINGAGGGVGPLAIQLAKRHGVEVTGVDSTDKQDYLRSLGFDHVIDYSDQDFTRSGEQYDLILDVKTTRSPFAYARALAPHGTYVTVGGTPLRLLQCWALRRLVARTTQRHIRILGLTPNQGLDRMTTLVEAGVIVPSIDAVYPLDDVPLALQRFGEARQKGKLIISMRPRPETTGARAARGIAEDGQPM